MLFPRTFASGASHAIDGKLHRKRQESSRGDVGLSRKGSRSGAPRKSADKPLKMQLPAPSRSSREQHVSGRSSDAVLPNHSRPLFNKMLAWGLSMSVVGALICWAVF